MLVVKIELHSAVTGEVTTLATGKIVNTGTGTPTRGNYVVVLRDAAGREWRRGTVADFPRKRLLAWDLLYRALEELVGKRNCALKTSADGASTVGKQSTTKPQGDDHDRPTAESERHPQAP